MGMTTTEKAFPPEYFDKFDETNDSEFYETERKVVHIDDLAIAHLKTLYDQLLPDGCVILDLMSSWRSHLPETKQFAAVMGHGMNSAEMDDNPQLSDHFIQNLNENQTLPFSDAMFDAVLCAVSVQYLQKPLEVFAEVHRILKPGGAFIVSFSNRCFPTKAVNAWVYSDDEEHVGLVNSYFRFSAQWQNPSIRLLQPEGSDPLYILWAFK